MCSHTRRAVRSYCVLSCLGLISLGLIGCGGSDSSSPAPSPTVSPSPTASPSTTPARARIGIEWGDRSRVEGLSSALSAEIRLKDGKEGGGDLVFTAQRPPISPSQPTEYRGSPAAEYTSVENALTGRPLELTVTFFAEPNQGGSVVGVARATATVRGDGSVATTITTFGTIRSIIVAPNQTVQQGQTIPLQYQARAADGTPIMVRPGAARIRIASGTDRAAIEGDNLRGIRPRDASVVVTIDQASSAATPVFVTSDTVVTPNVTRLDISILKTFDFSANVTGSNITDSGVIWGISGAPADASITANGRLTVGRTETVTPFTVTATSVYDPAKVVSIPVNIASKVVVAIQNKATAIVGVGDPITLTVVVSDPDGPISDAGVNWSVVDRATGNPANGLGTINAAGLYTAPNAVGLYRVVATSRFDTRKTDFVDVEVRAGSVGVVVE